MENVTQVQAILSYSKKQFNKWLDIRWQLIDEWHKSGQKTGVKPCMRGEHWHKGTKYVL